MELSDLQKRLLKAAYDQDREHQYLSMRDWAEEQGLDYHEVSDASDALEEEEWLRPVGIGGTVEISGEGIIGAEEEGIIDPELVAANGRLRTEILEKAADLSAACGPRERPTFGELETEFPGVDEKLLNFNLAVLRDIGYIARCDQFPLAFELSRSAQAGVDDLRARRAMAASYDAVLAAPGPETEQMAWEVVDRLATRDGWELVRDEDKYRVYGAEGEHYMLQVVCTPTPADRAVVRAFRSVLARNPALKGIMVSFSGFDPEARELVASASTIQPISAVDDEDIAAILSAESGFAELVTKAVDGALAEAPLGRGESGVISALGFPFAPPELEPRDSGVFVAHPYSGFTVDDFRSTLREVLGQQDLQPEYADEVITTEHILRKICRQIQETRFGIYDLSNWNPNVTLELGIAMALSRPMLLLLDTRTGTEPPADLSGLGRVHYSSMIDLAEQLAHKLPGFLNTI